MLPAGRTTRSLRRHSEEWLVDLVSSTDLTPLFQVLSLETLTVLPCTARAWRQAVDQFRADESRVGGMAECVRFRSFYGAAQFVERVLTRYSNLQHLNISDVPIAVQQSVRDLLPRWPMLRSLDMGSRSVSAAINQRNRLCNVLPSLRELTLHDPVCITDTELERYLRSPQLRRLTVSDSRLIQILAGGGWHTDLSDEWHTDSTRALGTEVAGGLEQLYLNRAEHLEHAMSSVAKSCPGLRVLKINGCFKVTNASIAAIGRACPSLEELLLVDCVRVGDGAVKAVAAGCPRLKELRLVGCERVTSNSITAVAHKCPQLEILDLHELERAYDSAFLALAEGCPRLRILGACETGLCAAGLAALLKNASLSQLHAAPSRCLSLATIQEARERHPDVRGRIRYDYDHVDLLVVTQDESFKMAFRCKLTRTLQKMMHIFCDRLGVEVGSMRFSYNEELITENTTPLRLEMVDGDSIVVMGPHGV